MNILTPENQSCDTNRVTESSSELHYCVFDYSNQNDADYKFLPMVFVEEFAKASIELKIGNNILQVPMEWSILIGDREFGEIELMPLSDFHGRDFEAFVFNPISGFYPEYWPIETTNIYPEIKWCVPTMKPAQLLAVGLSAGDQPKCVYFSNRKIKFPDHVQLSHLI